MNDYWTCLLGFVRFFAGTLFDALRGQDAPRRRAVRLRQIMESMGPTYVKLGQQISLRADLFPYDLCEELSKLLDKIPPISTSQAIHVIEKSLKHSIHDICSSFDPIPIGSASLACVYQARLKTGEAVAIKVRRPAVDQTLAADLVVLGWFLRFAEWLTLMRPGFTESLRTELKAMLLRELDFRTEARFMDIFRRETKGKSLSVTAPRVFFQWCTEEVLIMELIHGIPMTELMMAVDRQDQNALAEARSHGIDPKTLAQNLAQAVHVELLENLFFHADPHPANMLVLPGNVIW